MRQHRKGAKSDTIVLFLWLFYHRNRERVSVFEPVAEHWNTAAVIVFA